MNDRIVLTFLDVPNGKEILVNVPEELGRLGFANFIAAGLDKNPTWVLTKVTVH